MFKFRLAALATLAALALSFVGPAHAQLVRAPAYSSGGQPQQATGVFCLNLNGTSCTFGSGGGGGGAITAAAGSFATGFSPDLGKIGDLVCATDNGSSCDLIQLVMRTNARITSLIATAASTAAVAGVDGINPASAANPFPTLDGSAGSTGSAPPAKATQMGVVMNGVLAAPIGCDKSVVYDASTSGETQLVAASGSTVIYVCGYTMLVAGTVNVNLASADTGGACANPVKLTPAYQLTAQVGAVDVSPFFRGMKTPGGKALCWNASGGVAGQGIVYYAQF